MYKEHRACMITQVTWVGGEVSKRKETKTNQSRQTTRDVYVEC